MTNDWTHVTATSAFTAHHHGHGDNKPSNILINGRGKYFGNLTGMEEPQILNTKVKLKEINIEENLISTTMEAIMKDLLEDVTDINEDASETTVLNKDDDDADEENTEKIITTTEKSNLIIEGTSKSSRIKRALLPPDSDSPFMPYEVFNVVKGNRYRFRYINAGFLNCPIELSIDNHTITAIATDGNDIEPKEVTFLVAYAGERWDFVVNANQNVDNYFIRARGLMDCDERFTSSFQMAVLHYQGAMDEDPRGIKPSYKLNRKGITLNALNKGFGEENSITVAEAHAQGNLENKISKIDPDYKFYLAYDFYAKDNPLFHNAGLYGFNQGENKLNFTLKSKIICYNFLCSSIWKNFYSTNKSHNIQNAIESGNVSKGVTRANIL